MTTVEKLRKMRALLARRNGWTQGYAARNATGEPVHYSSPTVACCCIVGASWIIAGRVNDGRKDRAALRAFLGITDLVNWNDSYGRTQAEVLAAIDGTIEGLSE